MSTGQDLLGNNMFAYCGNNSVVLTDPTGTCGYMAGTTVWKPCGRRNCPSYSPYTLAVGVAGSITLGPIAYGLQFALVSDSLGASEIQMTYYSPLSSDALKKIPSSDQMLAQSATYEKFSEIIEYSLVGTFSAFNAPSVSDLHNEGYQIGGAWGKGTAIAVDYNIVPNGSGTPYKGITFSTGLGSTDGHASMGYTMPLFSSIISVFDVLYAMHNTIYGR